MRITTLLLILLIGTISLKANNPIEQFTSIQVVYGSKVLVINGELLYPDDLFSKYVEAIGTYDRVIPSEQYLTFYFDAQGITILVDKSIGKVEEITFQYLPQRGAGSTIALFEGEIVINDRSLASFHSAADIQNYFQQIEFTEVMDVLVMTQQDSFNVGVIFTQDNQLELCSIQFF